MENKQLQEEAEEYCKLVPEVITKKMTLDECIAIVNEFVINSKYVEQEKLKFAVELLNKIKEAEIYNKIRYIESSEIDYQIMKIQQQLKELEK